jgi:ubiquinone/menaquinone biosynthesis C-methylase UbiE
MSADRFEGTYGRVYTQVMQTTILRRAVFSLWGSADPLLHLDEVVNAAVQGCPDGRLLDVPCGGGTLIPLLRFAGFRGTLIESDLADAMMRRAQRTTTRLAPAFAVRFAPADARALPIEEASIDTVISINGLHVIPEPRRFLNEIARVLRPGGSLWLITPVSSTSIRSRAILAAARRLNITSAPPPTPLELHSMIEHAGLRIRRSLGGESITGLVCDR